MEKEQKPENVWICFLNNYVEVIIDDGIDPLRPHIIKKTGLLIGADSNFVFIRGDFKTEALAVKNIERIAKINDREGGFRGGS